MRLRTNPKPGSLFAGLFFVLAGIGLSSCGGLNEELHSKRGPFLNLSQVLRGELEGRRLFFDRNGNIKETAQMRRSCSWEDETRGECRETIQTFYNGALLQNTLQWRVVYGERNEIIVSLKDGRGEQRGEVHGSVLSLEGFSLVPGEKEKSAAVKTRYFLLPARGRPVLYETELFSRFGFTLGSARTFWWHGSGG